jgi:hypothetical protein
MFRMLRGEKTGIFWAGLIVLSLSLVSLFGIICLIKIEIPETVKPSELYYFWIIPANIKLELLAAPIAGCVIFTLIGFYMMRSGVRSKEAIYIPPVKVARLPLEIADVEGIDPKMERQLKAIGIRSIEDLAETSANELAVKLKIPPEATSKLIKEAKKLMDWWKLLCSYIYEGAKKSS